MEIEIGIFGAPQRILSNNGFEFQNDEMRMLEDWSQIKMLGTAAVSLEQ